jgi:hypothetical protein
MGACQRIVRELRANCALRLGISLRAPVPSRCAATQHHQS